MKTREGIALHVHAGCNIIQRFSALGQHLGDVFWQLLGFLLSCYTVMEMVYALYIFLVFLPCPLVFPTIHDILLGREELVAQHSLAARSDWI